MERYLARFSDPIYALTRIVVGFLFFCHGAQKLFGWFGGIPMELNAVIALAGVIEVVGGAMVALGLFAGWAAFICSGQMAVAYFGFHMIPNGGLPITNGGEPAALYAWIFLLIAARGGGAWSITGGKGAPSAPALD